ncbi:hypothetical protein WJX72_000543 [[Myrmecia] bisecta]|uniref:ATP-dependent helicase BRM n=1 Tax=[Myrmecia] bisecta TaxID=41462 RepID=A0AAW1Q6C4_9CHLO
MSGSFGSPWATLPLEDIFPLILQQLDRKALAMVNLVSRTWSAGVHAHLTQLGQLAFPSLPAPTEAQLRRFTAVKHIKIRYGGLGVLKGLPCWQAPQEAVHSQSLAYLGRLLQGCRRRPCVGILTACTWKAGGTVLQLNVLRNQILAFRRIKRGDLELPQDVLDGIKPSPLLGLPATPAQPAKPAVTQPVQSAYRPAAPAAQVPPRPANAPATVSRPYLPTPVPAAGQAAQPRPVVQRPPTLVETTKHLPPVKRQTVQTGPLFTLVGANVPKTQHPGMLPPYQLNFDLAHLMAMESRALLAKKRQEKMQAVQRQLQESEATRDTQGGLSQGERLNLRIQLRMLGLLERQAAVRQKVEAEQQEVMNMSDRAYRKFVRHSMRQRIEMIKQEEKVKADRAGERVRAIKAWRSAQSDASNTQRDLRVARNRAVARAHERMSREHHKQKDDDRARRMEALKAHDFEAYQELLREQSGPETSVERYEVISRFLNDTEEYLHRLAGKVASVKLGQEASEAAAQAIAEARAQGLSEDEVRDAATTAAQEAALNSDLMRQSKNHMGDAQSRYYGLAHSVEEVVRNQPSLLRPPGDARLREYQMVGLQWMVSLYNNHLNGILADEMGLGKTVQVMALLAYLMEHKNNFGPHLIIVPNAVIVNWKSELTQWLPSVRCVYYVGQKEERARKYAAEVQSLQFNVLVTTYEFIMRDRAKLAKIEWNYIIIDEAQRMKDRQSKLAKDLDRFTAARRLLLTGTPLQNELAELWSLLNLLLPEVFDDKGTFAEWFGDSLGKAGGAEEDWLEKEKRVVVIHRLHQILEPFMLRRQVEDVESKLPEKVAVVVKVAMPAFQAAIYDWVKETGTIRLDPTGLRTSKHHHAYAPLNNKCMELRKVCNHPYLSYPPDYNYNPELLVRCCGKLAVLDRLLVKLHAAGHRVLLFSTMTRLLDLLEVYLRWRRVGADQQDYMHYLRIDGATSLEDRESAIQRFNAPNSKVFIFLLSIRAAGRGLNLQSADTVVIYDPDPNPKNEEQAIARSHRIGQTREVRVIHLEAVANAPPEAQAAEPADLEQGADPGAPPQRKYADSIESLVRNNIQKMKIDMANEVIDAGRFDMRTTMEERKHTLEAMLQDEERLKRAVNHVPSHAELNAMVARSEEERLAFDRMDAELQWPLPPLDEREVPSWLRFTERDVDEALASTNRQRPNQAGAAGIAEAKAAAAAVAAAASAQLGRGHSRGKSTTIIEVDDNDAEFLMRDDDTEEEVIEAGNVREDTEEVAGTSSRATSGGPSQGPSDGQPEYGSRNGAGCRPGPSAQQSYPGGSAQYCGRQGGPAGGSAQQPVSAQPYHQAQANGLGQQQQQPGSGSKRPYGAAQDGWPDGGPDGALPPKKQKRPGLKVKFGGSRMT